MKKIAQNLTLDKELVEKIKEEAEKENRSKSWIVNNIIEKYFKK